MARFQPIYDIAELCSKKGLTHAILCPGSRCAPLTLAFVRHPAIRVRTFSDERSAGFVALGVAQQQNRPSILLCTSGTAVYNFAPAVAEAHFSGTPLIVFTADRPLEWIGQHDGQTIYQPEIFGRHVKRSFQLPQDYDHADSVWALNRIVNEAINLSMETPRGPVHINVPLREPLYPAKDEVTTYSEQVRVIEAYPQHFPLTDAQKDLIQQRWPAYHNILLVAGQQPGDAPLVQTLNDFFKRHNIPIAGDITANLHAIDKLVKHADLFLGQASADVKKTLRPDLLITFGKSVLAKNLKTFLRKNPPREHWHIQPAGVAHDTFQSVTHIFHTEPVSFFHYLSTLPRTENFESQKQNNYAKLWEIEERRTLRTLEESFTQAELTELELVKDIIINLPDRCNLHLANSMSVRYANFIGLHAEQKAVNVWANRGTSGIDGCSSTAVGHSLTSDTPNILITGDLAFFYDRNAYWHNYALPNLRVVVLNNHGGVIFGMIDGPGSLPEADEFFITQQRLSAKKLCEEFGFEHLKLDNRRKLKNLIKDFYDFDGKTKILELETDTLINRTSFDQLKLKLKKSYEL